MAVCAQCGRENAADARFCSGCGAPLSSDGPPDERRKVVTVLFTDLVGSTSLGEGLDPEAVRRVMSRYFDAMRAVVEKHGGTVEKFIGDAIMAVFGIPTLHEDDALRASRAAAEMRDALAGLNVTLEREQKIRLTTRTGVNTGEVVAGDAAARQQLATGDAVNVAARLEQAARPGEILLGGPRIGSCERTFARSLSSRSNSKVRAGRWRRGSSSNSCRTFLPSRGRSLRHSSGAKRSLRHSGQRSIRLREVRHA